MIPGILRPDIKVVCEESMTGLHYVETNGQEASHLDPNGGFRVLTSCTEEVVLGLPSAFCSMPRN